MYRKVLISGVTAAAIVGAGGTALAITGSDTTAGTPSTTSSAAKAGKAGGEKGKLLKRLAHGQIVAKGPDGTFVTHDLILGTVTSVSATSITVQAADKTSETFSVSKDTLVRQRTTTKGKGTASSIDKIAKGDNVLVTGTGTSNYAAKRVIELAK